MFRSAIGKAWTLAPFVKGAASSPASPTENFRLILQAWPLRPTRSDDLPDETRSAGSGGNPQGRVRGEYADHRTARTEAGNGNELARKARDSCP